MVKQKSGSVKWCALILLLALVWRMLGAPLNRQDFQNLQTPVWQARILLPQRVERILRLWLPAEETETSVPSADESTILVYLTQEDRLVQMTMGGYVCGVLAAEMPAQYHLEALKAQAVAARTRAMAQKREGGCERYPGAEICTDSAHCQGYASLSECREQWGSSFEAYRDRMIQAQQETAGEWLAYEDKPITVLYHAISGGRTENVQTVFAESLPYLVSVESEEDESIRGFRQEITFPFEQLSEKLGLPAEEIRRSLSIGGYTESGRVSHVLAGDERIEATELRQLLGLRSTWFSISINDDGVTFHQRGYGHGVGMSQAGANSMAASGADYRQILAHYYTGVEIIHP